MPDLGTLESERFDRPQVIDQGTLKRIQQIIPVEKAALPIVEHNLELIDTARALRSWYLGSVMRTPRELMSTLLDPNLNNAARSLTMFVATARRFDPGAFPAHCEVMRQFEFTTVQLIRTLMTLIESPVLVEALKQFNAFIATLSDATNFLLSDDEIERKLDTRLNQLLNAFGEISQAFRRRERQRDIEYAFRKDPPPPATKEDVKDVVNAAASSTSAIIAQSSDRAADKVVAAIEKGTAKIARATRKKGRKPKTKIDVQEAVWNIHEREKHNEEVKAMGHGRATRENEFLHAKRELKTYGIVTEKAYIDLLNTRTKRHSRAAAKLLN